MAIDAIREVALLIYDAREFDTTGSYELADALRQDGSDEGWRLATPGSLGSTVVTEGVHLGAAGVRRAWDMADRWLQLTAEGLMADPYLRRRR